MFLRINVKLTNLYCESFDKKLIEFRQCSLKAIKRDMTEISVYAKLKIKPLNSTSIKVSFRRRGDTQRSLYQYRVDACEFMRNKRRNPLAQIFFNFFDFLKYSNINHTCPYDFKTFSQHDIIITNCRVNTKPLTYLSIAQGEYTLFSTWFFYGKPAVQVDLSINIS
ncbi:hypothetical protein CVS40_9453 [Lucilia cuprina]|nr:hypothetical protein CVS40_9453 [Lucilia cuprina]